MTQTAVPMAQASGQLLAARAIRIGLLALALMCLAVQAAAADRYWVVLGSFDSTERAEQSRQQASKDLQEEFAVQAADAGAEHEFRVVAGPFVTRELAEDGVAKARENGYSKAWLQSNTKTQSASVAENSQSAAPSEHRARPDRFNGRYDSGLDRRDAASAVASTSSTGELPLSQANKPLNVSVTRTDRYQPLVSSQSNDGVQATAEPAEPAAQASKADGVPTLVEKAPSNFGLNKLRRE